MVNDYLTNKNTQWERDHLFKKIMSGKLDIHMQKS